jgi:hypothetical protein
MLNWLRKTFGESEPNRTPQPSPEPEFRPAKLPPRRSTETQIATSSSTISARPFTAKNPAEMMRRMRRDWLTKVPEPGSCTKNDEVVAVLMDWPLDSQIVTVLASSVGDASLYTTGTFGIFGGIEHERVRAAATAFVSCAQHVLSITSPATSFPYPDKQSLLFYMVTASGVRMVSFSMSDIERADSPASALYASGQQVVTELRLIYQISNNQAA